MLIGIIPKTKIIIRRLPDPLLNPLMTAMPIQPSPVMPITSTPPSDNTIQNTYYGLTACANRGPAPTSKSGTVQWTIPQPASVSIFASTTADSAYGSDTSYMVGHFTSGQYKGADLLITILAFDEPGGPSWYRIVRQGSNYIVLDKYSDTLPDPAQNISYAVKLTEDKNFDLADLDFPQTLHSQNPAADFTYPVNLGFFKNGSGFFCADHYVKMFTDPNVGDVYSDDLANQPTSAWDGSYISGFGFYVKAPDGSEEVYQLNINFIGQDKLPLVTWANGKKNSEDYSYQALGGCGATQFLDVENVKESDLAQIGTSFDGQVIYGYKDQNVQELKDMFNEIYTPDGQPKPTYQQFLADNPIFFWKDPFGQFVRFKIMKYQPLAECAKPVIYLYPQQTEKVSVKLSPVGGFTYTEPAYNDGWNVISDPNSNITNLADSKTYPYLFWEGRGGLYQTPAQGFVVAQADVHTFLTDKLRLLGLNDKESADFMEFWEPKMQSSSYYFVTFLGSQTMDKIAPLSIIPAPDTVIRILMDFMPLEKPIAVEGFNIRTPMRKGFTVVEWGGVLR